jgi:hypothetical protein
MYYNGQIITNAEHIAFANWNNVNGRKFRSESMGDGTYKIVEIVIPEPTEYEKAQARIAELKQLLAGTDYVVLKIAEGVATREDYESVLAQRQAWREEINQLETIGE